MRRAEIGDLVGLAIGHGRAAGGERAHHAGPVHDVDLVGLCVLAQRHRGLVPRAVTKARAAHPRERDIRTRRDGFQVHRRIGAAGFGGIRKRGLAEDCIRHTRRGRTNAPGARQADTGGRQVGLHHTGIEQHKARACGQRAFAEFGGDRGQRRLHRGIIAALHFSLFHHDLGVF